ncbi:MAG TPA: magnesium transporter [Bacillota bacterium]|nr:magnesium transporter [Bacillota bacterium]
MEHRNLDRDQPLSGRDRKDKPIPVGEAVEMGVIKSLINARNWDGLRDYLVENLPIAEIADLLSDLDKGDRVLVFRVLPREIAAEVFAYLEPFEQDDLLRDLTDEEARHIMANLAPDDRTELLEELPAQVTARLLEQLSPEDLEEVRWLLGYPEKSVGRLMTPDYLSVPPDWTVGQALDHVRRWGRDSETASIIYVVDSAGKLIGAVSLRQLVLETPESKIGDIMKTSVISVNAFDDRRKAYELMQRYGLWVLPVTDSEGVLLGIVTGDDVLEVATERITEDFHKSAGVSPIRVSLADASPLVLYRSRVLWLVLLSLMYLLSGGVMSSFEGAIASTISLVFFLPLILDCAGNAGSQSAVLVLRDIGVGDVTFHDWPKVFVRELAVSSIIGLIVGALVMGVGTVSQGVDIGVVVGIAMFFSVVTVSCLGAMVPFALMKLGWDPASASSPLVASIADILGVIIYFFTAKVYLGM